jgi:hypothetical protein
MRINKKAVLLRSLAAIAEKPASLGGAMNRQGLHIARMRRFFAES